MGLEGHFNTTRPADQCVARPCRRLEFIRAAFAIADFFWRARYSWRYNPTRTDQVTRRPNKP
jgi:hypothetical protein